MGAVWADGWRSLGRFEKWVALLWTLGLLGILVRVLILPPGARSLFPIYYHAGIHWATGADLYPETQAAPGDRLFRYTPTVALAMRAFAPLPEKAGDCCWRLLNMAALLGGIGCLAHGLAPVSLTRKQIAVLLALLLPAGISYLSNGQCNALVIGLVLIAFAAAAGQRWNLAAAALAIAVLFKLYPVAAGLLLGLLYPRRSCRALRWPCCWVRSLPFAFQTTDYVLRQYGLWARYMLAEDRSTWSLKDTNLDLQMLYRVWVGPMTLQTYHLVEVAAGAAFGFACLASRWAGRPERRQLTFALAWPASG